MCVIASQKRQNDTYMFGCNLCPFQAPSAAEVSKHQYLKHARHAEFDMFSFQSDSHSNNFEERGATDLSSRPVAAKTVDMGSGHIFDATGKVWKQSDFLSRTRPPKAKMVQPDRICKLRDLVQVGRQCKKQTRTRFITSWKPRYIWITEDLLQLRCTEGS